MIVKFKCQNSNDKINPKSKCQIPKPKLSQLVFVICAYFEFCALGFVITPLHAKEITILYTGSTHAMLYPCSCPREPDGGVSRRATLIKRLRKEYPDALLLDSGSFFAGGLLDEYTQNTQLDSQRSLVNLKAMQLMKYDVLNIGPDEFNFGREFLEANINQREAAFLSCNIKSDKLLPYIIRDIGGSKIGIIGVTSLSALKKAGGLEFIEPNIAVASQVAELKKNGAGIILLLSQLPESEELGLINDIRGIDILISGNTGGEEKSSKKISHTLILRPTRQGRSLGKLTFRVEDNKLINYKVEELRLSDKISDDSDILSILPHCFSDVNCKKKGLIGSCQDAGSLKSRCLFTEANKINLLVITAKDCITCATEIVVNSLKRKFPGLLVSYVYYPDRKARNLIKNFSISGLPAYLLGKEIKREKVFDSFKEKFVIKGDFFMLKPQFSGISYLPGRKIIKGRLDLFISLFDKNSRMLLEVIKEFNPAIHFLTTEQEGRFDAGGGNLEIEENLRAVCVQKYSPGDFWDYISCRSKNINSSWWEDCAANLDVDKIASCAKGEEGSSLLKKNVFLNKELGVMFGPTYLLDNQKIFGSKGVPSKEELRKIIKR